MAKLSAAKLAAPQAAAQPAAPSVYAAAAQAAAALSGAFARPPGYGLASPSASTSAPKGFKPAPLRLDDQGREIDEFGNVVQKRAEAVTSLKVNQKKEQVKVETGPPQRAPEDFFDPELGHRGLKRLERKPRMGFDFVKEGRFQKDAENQRLRARLGDEGLRQLRERQQQEKRDAAKFGDANLIPLGEKLPSSGPEQKPLEPIPDVEWWDARILAHPESYAAEMGEEGSRINAERITHYVEHPVPIQPPAEEAPPPPMPLMLTKKEHKKLRTQRRVEKEKEKQELIRQGLLEPPAPKVKISNLMRVMGSEATADPTAMEQEVRRQMQERQQAHDDRNLSRKLTPAERKEKKMNKLVGEAGEGSAELVSVYCVRDLSHPQNKFKVRVNAEELHMTGCAVITDDITLVVAEGGQKAQKRYRKLMLNRIDWNAGRDEDEEDQPDIPGRTKKPPNACQLVWEGMVREAAFQKFLVEQCRTEGAAKKFLADRGLTHYWDVAKASIGGE
ncbi:hypothetical protein WJX72_003724 [[Myrmecia] bisecta]|uniref:Uncharacterized protein n=1 Tax=[Myrmecia] bisecta TaxID=41462 RepID=A0AAW1R5J1_9CHLO